MTIEWHSFLIPGVFFVTIGIGFMTPFGLGPLTGGAVVVGLLLCLAAVLRALEEREAPPPDAGG